jgi:receptor protein-tyrosine kinase
MTSAHAAVADPNVLHGLIEQIKEVPWDPNPEAHIIDHTRVSDAPAEEFRSLRTRLNHVQGLQQLRSLVVTSASPAEGKSFTAANLAVVQSHLQGNLTLLCDFDFRRPIAHSLPIDRSPGTEYQGKAAREVILPHQARAVCPRRRDRGQSP